MSSKNLEKKIRELKRLEDEADEIAAQIAAQIDGIKDQLKAELTARKVDQLKVDVFKITWREVISKRVDTTTLKRELPEVAARYTIESVSRPFKISA